MSETTQAFRALQDEAFELFRKKNADYGDSFKEDGILGVMIRAKDKLNRLISLARKDGEAAVQDEALRDTLIDHANYSLMAILAHEDGEEWAETRPGRKTLLREPERCGECLCSFVSLYPLSRCKDHEGQVAI